MKKILSIPLLLLCVLLCSKEADAQQDPQYTQYMYNMNVINPAYAGSSEGLGVGLLYRSQWEGLDGAPETSTVNIHTPIGNNVGLGMSIISDQIGPVKETNAYIDFSYTLNLANENRLAFGLKAGVTSHDIGLVDLTLIDLNDPFFANDISEMTPNIGAGVYFGGKLLETALKVVKLSILNNLAGALLGILQWIFLIGTLLVFVLSLDKKQTLMSPQKRAQSVAIPFYTQFLKLGLPRVSDAYLFESYLQQVPSLPESDSK